MSDSLSGQIYAAILGGKESDALLHRVTEDTVRPFIPGADVVDTGVGRGGLTKRLAQLGPKNLWVTDYQQPSIDRAMRQIASMNGTRPPGLNVHSCLLDLTGDLTALGDTRADVIVCVSVLMHLPPAEAKKAVMKLSRRLKPGGRAVIGVLSASVARALYIPAPSKGECCFYPALKGLPARATEADVPERASSLLEYYPPDQFYRAVCEETGLRVSVVDALPGDECKGSIYESVSGPLWKLFVLES